MRKIVVLKLSVKPGFWPCQTLLQLFVSCMNGKETRQKEFKELHSSLMSGVKYRQQNQPSRMQLVEGLEHETPQLEPYWLEVAGCSPNIFFPKMSCTSCLMRLCTFTRTKDTSLPLLQWWPDSQMDTLTCSLHPSSRLRTAQELHLPLAGLCLALLPYTLRYIKGGCQLQ